MSYNCDETTEIMTNKEIATALKLLGKLTELHDGNEFKVKSYLANAFKIERLPQPLENMSAEEIEKIDGIGKGTHAKIDEINKTGTLKELQDLLAKTPLGVLEILSVKGIGPKKVRTIWKELEVESVGEGIIGDVGVGVGAGVWVEAGVSVVDGVGVDVGIGVAL